MLEAADNHPAVTAVAIALCRAGRGPGSYCGLRCADCDHPGTQALHLATAREAVDAYQAAGGLVEPTLLEARDSTAPLEEPVGRIADALETLTALTEPVCRVKGLPWGADPEALAAALKEPGKIFLSPESPLVRIARGLEKLLDTENIRRSIVCAKEDGHCALGEIAPHCHRTPTGRPNTYTTSGPATALAANQCPMCGELGILEMDDGRVYTCRRCEQTWPNPHHHDMSPAARCPKCKGPASLDVQKTGTCAKCSKCGYSWDVLHLTAAALAGLPITTDDDRPHVGDGFCKTCRGDGFCKTCRGTGYEPTDDPAAHGDEVMHCTDCAGTGKRGPAPCPDCEGKGKTPLVTKTCGTCRGSGLVSPDGQRVVRRAPPPGVLTCPSCAGIGVVQEEGWKKGAKCPTCEGKGHLVASTADPHETIPCPDCKGTGGTNAG